MTEMVFDHTAGDLKLLVVHSENKYYVANMATECCGVWGNSIFQDQDVMLKFHKYLFNYLHLYLNENYLGFCDYSFQLGYCSSTTTPPIFFKLYCFLDFVSQTLYMTKNTTLRG